MAVQVEGPASGIGAFVIEVTSGTAKFLAVDPSTYPFAQYEFSDETSIKEVWSNIQPGEVVADFGASFGGWTLMALALGATVLAVEPSELCCGILRQSIEANGWQSRVRVVKAIVWDDTPFPESFRAAGISNFGGAGDVPLYEMDALISEFGFGRLDRIKMDIEGAEWPALRSGRRTLAEYHPQMVIEVHDKPADAQDVHLIPHVVGVRNGVIAELTNAGYSLENRLSGNPFIVGTYKCSK